MVTYFTSSVRFDDPYVGFIVQTWSIVIDGNLQFVDDLRARMSAAFGQNDVFLSVVLSESELNGGLSLGISSIDVDDSVVGGDRNGVNDSDNNDRKDSGHVCASTAICLN